MTAKLPKDFELPEGASEGEEFDAVGTFIVQNGEVTISAIDGVPLSEDMEDSAEDESPAMEESPDDESPGGFMESVEKRLA